MEKIKKARKKEITWKDVKKDLNITKEDKKAIKHEEDLIEKRIKEKKDNNITLKLALAISIINFITVVLLFVGISAEFYIKLIK